MVRRGDSVVRNEPVALWARTECVGGERKAWRGYGRRSAAGAEGQSQPGAARAAGSDSILVRLGQASGVSSGVCLWRGGHRVGFGADSDFVSDSDFVDGG
jgi:hypothetical protein